MITLIFFVVDEQIMSFEILQYENNLPRLIISVPEEVVETSVESAAPITKGTYVTIYKAVLLMDKVAFKLKQIYSRLFRKKD